MSLQENKALSRRQIEMWSEGNSDSPEEIFSPNYINHQESDVEGEGHRDLGGFKDLVNGFHRAFSNSQVTVLSQIAEGDLVSTRWEITATNTGDYMDLAKATNLTMTWRGVLTDRFENGKIAETWVDWDEYRFFKALGLITR